MKNKWYDEKTFFTLPRACNEVFKGVSGNLQSLVRKQARFGENKNGIPNYNFQFSNVSTASINLSNKNESIGDKLTPNLSSRADRKNSFINYNSRIKDESTDEYNEHYNCHEYTSFDSLHYFELSRLLRSTDRTQYSSTGDHPLSLLFSNFKNSILGTPKMIKELDESKSLRSNQTVSEESSEEESLCQDFEKIQTLNNDSNDFLLSLSLERAKLNQLDPASANLELMKTPVNQGTCMRNSASDNTNLKSLANKKISLSSLNDFNRRASFSGREEVLKSLNRSKNIYGSIYTYPNKSDQKLYSEYVLFANLSGEFDQISNFKQQKFNNSQFTLNRYNFDEEDDKSRVGMKRNKKLSKQFTSETDLASNQKVNFKIPTTPSDQLTSLINYDSLDYKNNQEINEYLEQINSNESKEDKRLLSNYLDESFNQIKVGSKCKEDYKQYLRLIS